MMRKVTQNSFLGGQLDFEMMGRHDVERYSKGATTIRNFLPCRRGALRKRPGTDLRHDVTSYCGASAEHLRLVPFSWREDDGWALLVYSGGMVAFSRTGRQAVTKAEDASWYTGAQVDEFDYCQCGDMVFLAHRGVPPQKISHAFDGTSHVFRLETMDVNGRSVGRPTITSASVTKQKVLDLGGVVTESYKATAVYDGVETFPSPAFRDASSPQDDATNDYTNWKHDNNMAMQNGTAGIFYPIPNTYDGTSYHAPWTKSQILKLLTDKPTKNGAVPDQIRFYRRQGSFFGLVGFIQPGESSGGITVTLPAISDTTDGDDVGASLSDAKVIGFSADVWGVRVRVTLGATSLNGSAGILQIKASMCANAEATTVKRTVTKRLTISEAYGTVELAFSNSQGSKGRAVKIYKASGSTTVRVKAVEVLAYQGESTTGDITDDGQHYQWIDEYFEPDVSRTPPKEEYYMNEPGEYPGCVCLSQQRLIWASTENEPSRVLMSQTGDFYTYAPHEAMVADDPIDFQVSATRLPAISHIVEMRKLLLFNGGSEWVVDSASESQGITYETIQARQHSAIGAASWLKPIVCDNVLLFAEKTGRAVRRYGYQLEDDGFGGVDVSFCSASIFSGRRIVSWAYQKQPESTCWCVLSDGTLASLTFVPEQQTVAWATHALGGGFEALQIVATDAVVGNPGGYRTDNQVFVLAKRTVSGNVQYRVLELHCSSAHGGDTIAAALRLDCATVATGTGSLLSGEVAVNPTTGAVSTTVYAAGDICGYPYESVFESVRPVVGTEVGAAQMDVKNVQEAHLRVSDAVGGKVRARGVPAGQAASLTKTAPAFSSGRVALAEADENVPLVGDNTRDGRVVVTQSEPWPFTLLMLETDVETENEERGRR